MYAKARARAARASRDVLAGQTELFHVEQPTVERSPAAPPLPRELLVEMLGAVVVKVVRG
jgi:hypothetical protein